MEVWGRCPPGRADEVDRFVDRAHAGDLLGERLAALLGDQDVVVIALPRGGVPVAARVAARLDAPLDVVVVRKIGLPSQPEVAVGAVGEGGVIVINPAVARRLPGAQLDELAHRQEAEVEARLARWRSGPGLLGSLRGRTVVLVDDGIATGATARAAAAVLRHHGPDRVVLAVPVAGREALETLAAEVDDVVCLLVPDDFRAVGLWYEDFAQVPDDDVRHLLDDAAAGSRAATADVQIPSDVGALPGTLTVPSAATGLVVFAHGSGSSRHSPRNVAVAERLNDAGLATLLLDLLTAEEAADRSAVFDIPLLASRLAAATAWAGTEPALTDLPLGYFGASTGAGAALWAAADHPRHLRAVVSRGGRPDLAAERLPQVQAPTLLVVGALDTDVLALNRAAQDRLTCPTELAVVSGATHLFEEPGTLEAAGAHAVRWFLRHLHL